MQPPTFERLQSILLFCYDGLKFFCHRSGGSYSESIGIIGLYSPRCIASCCIVVQCHNDPIVPVVIITRVGSSGLKRQRLTQGPVTREAHRQSEKDKRIDQLSFGVPSVITLSGCETPFGPEAGAG